MKDTTRPSSHPDPIIRFMLRLLLPLSLLVLPGILQAYQPGKWSHTDPYIQTDLPGGPGHLSVLDSSGKLLKQAVYTYNRDGRLVEERYLDASGKEEGRTLFVYNSGRIVKERLLDRRGRLVSLQEHHYRKGELVETVVHDAQGRELIRQIYRYSKGRIVGGEEISGKQRDPFQFRYDGSGRLSAVQFLDGSNKVMGEILYHYNSSGKLVERIRTQAGTKSICRYQYNRKGRLKSYTYFNEQEGKLVQDRTLRLKY